MSKKIRVIIAGSRGFKDYKLLKQKCDHILKNYEPKDIEVVCGMCKGADLLGKRWADEKGIKVKKFPADWENLDVKPLVVKTREDGTKYNAVAGHNRNRQMAEYGTHLILFWDKQSSGSRDMLYTAIGKGLKVKEIIYGKS